MHNEDKIKNTADPYNFTQKKVTVAHTQFDFFAKDPTVIKPPP